METTQDVLMITRDEFKTRAAMVIAKNKILSNMKNDPNMDMMALMATSLLMIDTIKELEKELFERNEDYANL